MRFTHRNDNDPPPEKAVPLDVYASLVDALYEVKKSLLIGSVASTAAALLTAWKSGTPVLLAFAVAIALVAWLRNRDMTAFERARSAITTRKEFRRWEHRYVFGAALYVGLLSTWTLASFAVTDDPFIMLFTFSVTLAYMIGISGRNFASDLLVTSQIICAGVPLSLALFIVGDLYFAVFGLVVLPFFAGLRLISNRLRNVLLDAVMASREVTEIARRFDTALNNMPQGLCMFDRNSRLVVANRHVAGLLGIAKAQLDVGTPLRDILATRAPWRLNSSLDKEAFNLSFERLLRNGGSTIIELDGGKFLALTARPMSEGGSVLVIEDITRRRAAEARINRLAHYDTLTGLPNRSQLRQELDSAIAAVHRTGPLALLFIDLDDFKQVNDTLGHPCGDDVLGMVSKRLQAEIRPSDVAARFGGDEFVVIQNPISTPKEATLLAERIIHVMSQPFEIRGSQAYVSACVGIAIAPRDGFSSDRLLKNADIALYHAKTAGRSSWRFFEAVMDAEARARRAVENDLRKALEREEFELLFQPIVSTESMRITTCEALIRWHHPERGMILPSEFISVAEETGIIVEIGAWAIEQACRTCAHWPNDVRVAVNLSPVQFRRDKINSSVSNALLRSGLPPHRLELEITESVLLQDLTTAQLMLERLSSLGVRISLDDFGTGYSGLTYLQTFPINKVKIDRSFISDLRPESRSLILLHGIAELCSALGITVVVEGVEEETQLSAILEEPRVNEVQGYLVSRPLPASQISELIDLTAGKPRRSDLNLLPKASGW